jgi:hypothetical protein
MSVEQAKKPINRSQFSLEGKRTLRDIIAQVYTDQAAVVANAVLKDGTEALTADWDAGAFKITGETLESDVTTGTPPLEVASTTTVANLSSQFFDGNAIAAFGLLAVVGAWTKQQNFAEATLTDEANISWDLDDAQTAVITLGDDRTMDNPTNMVAGATYVLRIKQDGTGTRLITWDTAYLWAGGVAPTLTTTLTTGLDVISFYSDGTSMFGSPVLDFS